MRHAQQAGGDVALYVQTESGPIPDAVVMVMAENPYAEGQGDIDSLAWQQGNSRDLALIRQLKADGVDVVTIFLTGRPMWVSAEMNASDAFVVAWLPGSEGAAVADVLMAAPAGAAQYDFEGRLPMPWPNHDLNPDNQHLSVADHAFPVGFGLTAESTFEWVALNEQAIGQKQSLDEWVFD